MRQTTPRKGPRPSTSDAALRPWKLRPVEAELLARAPDHSIIKRFVRAAKRNLGLSIVTMDRHHDLTVMTLLMFVPVEPATLLGQPFAKRRAFHNFPLFRSVPGNQLGFSPLMPMLERQPSTASIDPVHPRGLGPKPSNRESARG